MQVNTYKEFGRAVSGRVDVVVLDVARVLGGCLWKGCLLRVKVFFYDKDLFVAYSCNRQTLNKENLIGIQ